MKKSILCGLVLLGSTTIAQAQQQEPPPAGQSQSSTVVMSAQEGPGGAPTNFSIMTAGSDGSMNMMSFSPGEGLMMGSPSMSGDPFSMLTSPEIQTELDVVGDQREQIMKLQQDYSARIREQIEAMRKNNFAPEKAGNIQQTIADLQAQQRRDIEELLHPRQRERLNQLAMQAKMKSMGAVSTLADKKVLEDLGITEEQIAKMREKAKELNKELEEKIAKLREETQQALLGELTKEQRTKLESMIGDKFEFPKPKAFETRRVKQSTEAEKVKD